MRLFHWLCTSEIPRACDLRRRGWRLTPPVSERGVAIAHLDSMDAADWIALTGGCERKRIVLLGVRCPGGRARLLDRGFGDVLGARPSLDELDARAARVAGWAETLPRSVALGRLRLDLLARDGLVDGRPLGLHPREFELFWRLAETPGVAVGKAALVGEVWRLPHVPETNSLAVHVSRLRAKLAVFGLAGLVQTAPGSGYMLERPALPLFVDGVPLRA